MKMNRYMEVSKIEMGGIREKTLAMNWKRVAIVYARVALGAAFLSAVLRASDCGTGHWI